MGQKINPVGLRLGIVRGWDSNWFGGKTFADKLVEDQKIRDYVNARIPKGGIAKENNANPNGAIDTNAPSVTATKGGKNGK